MNLNIFPKKHSERLRLPAKRAHFDPLIRTPPTLPAIAPYQISTIPASAIRGHG